MSRRFDSDIDFLEFNIPNNQANQMKFSMAVNYRKIIIDTIINEFSALEFMYYLNKIRDIDSKYGTKKPIEVYVNSNGGSAYECFMIVDMIEQMKKDGYKIITINAGKAYSAGMAIALCGSVRKCYKRARYMFHDVLSGTYGKSREILEHLEESNIIKNTYYDIISKYTDINLEDMYSWEERKVDKYFSAQEILELKGVEEIL